MQNPGETRKVPGRCCEITLFPEAHKHNCNQINTYSTEHRKLDVKEGRYFMLGTNDLVVKKFSLIFASCTIIISIKTGMKKPKHIVLRKEKGKHKTTNIVILVEFPLK